MNVTINQDNKNIIILWLLIILTILSNAIGLYTNILPSNDAYFYAIIAKNIVITNNYTQLVFNHTPWIDKPHLPFVLTALLFKVFTTNHPSAFAYILPGFCCHLIGALYCYKLTNYLYNSKVTSLIATLIYLSSLHLLISAIDVRAEAFLLAFIIIATYYWLRFYNIRYIILAAFATACALMTKGLFVLVTIYSGIITLLSYRWLCSFKQSPINNAHFLADAKYQSQQDKHGGYYSLLAGLLIVVFILPELFALYKQFSYLDSTKIESAINALKWFFWQSQFGRFSRFGGANAINHNNSSHYFYFVHSMLWSVLPWSLFFIVAFLQAIKEAIYQHSKAAIYLLGSFCPTFILFSFSKFQLDYYLNIIIPFASIMSGRFLTINGIKDLPRLLYYSQLLILLILLVVGASLFTIIFIPSSSITHIIAIIVLIIAISLIVTYFINKLLNKFLLPSKQTLMHIIIYSTIIINLIFIVITAIYNVIYVQYNAGYNIAQYLKTTKTISPVIDYNVNLLSLEFHLKQPYLRCNNPKQLENFNHYQRAYYFVTDATYVKKILTQATGNHAVIKIKSFPFVEENKFVLYVLYRLKSLFGNNNLTNNPYIKQIYLIIEQ